MKVMLGMFGVALALALSMAKASAQAQSADARPGAETVKTFYLTNVSRAEDANETVSALRNLLDATDKVYLVPSQNAIVIRATPDQLALAQRLLTDLDRLKKTYRITYTITESEEGKRIGTQHFAMIIVSGGKTTLKQGSKVPIMTGEYDAGKSTAHTEMTYLDVGLNFDASLDEFVDGMRLRTKVEQSAIAEDKAGAADPVIRQTVLEGTSIVTPGKPLVLGSLDIPGSPRHLDIEVVVDGVR